MDVASNSIVPVEVPDFISSFTFYGGEYGSTLGPGD